MSLEDDDSSDDLAPPELRFRYSNFELIGKGGMGRVLGAHDNRLNRPVAIKLLPRNSENALAVMRFQQEAKAVSKLNNPHVVQVLDFGYTEAGEPYLVMEQVKGSSLQSLLETNGAMPILDAINIAVQLCDALEHAHTNEVIHRDLKPGNIMIETDNVAKVLDFGLARIASMAETDWRLTRPGQPVGSVLYMSPEQVRGEDSDERADVYSLALVILKMVAGQLPFEGKTALEIIKLRLETEPPAIPALEGTSFDHALREELNGVISKALASDPEDRFANMSDFKKALLDAPDSASQIVASDENAAQTAHAAPRSSGFQASLIIVSLILVALSAVAYYLYNQRVADEKRLSTKHPHINSKADAKLREQIIDRREALILDKFEVNGSNRGTASWLATKSVTDDDLAKLVGIPISDITLVGNEQITSAGIKTLSQFPLQRLTLRNTNIDDRSIPYINEMKKLYFLDFQGSAITDAGLTQLSPKLNLSLLDLKELGNVTDRGVVYAINSFPNLQLLSISSTGVSRKCFQQLPKLTQLRNLRAAGVGITDDEIKVLSNMESLEALDLQSNPLTDQSIPYFEKLSKKRLTRLQLELCALITPDGLRYMQDNFKHTKITPQPLRDSQKNKQDINEDMMNLIK
ncbi:MAG: protein kinase [Candidatus Melainabacteria bacterium]|nr:protein kinase [Candidatus Melainabacteria bacterium]